MSYLIILLVLTLTACDIARQSQRRDHDILTRCLVSTTKAEDLDVDCSVGSSKEQHDNQEQKSLKAPVPTP
jgi:hypothetical protein